MGEDILQGTGRLIHRVPADRFLEEMTTLPAHMSARLAFMTREHHVVRDFVVREMPRQLSPLKPARIAETTGLELQKLTTILSDLEQHLFFLVRDAAGSVSWAFPVTTARTPYRLTFSTGKKIFGA